MDFEALKAKHGEDAVKEAFMLGVIQGIKQARENEAIGLRDKFAMAVLNRELESNEFEAETHPYHEWGDICKNTASECYQLADVMLKERVK